MKKGNNSLQSVISIISDLILWISEWRIKEILIFSFILVATVWAFRQLSNNIGRFSIVNVGGYSGVDQVVLIDTVNGKSWESNVCSGGIWPNKIRRYWHN